jgi:hypothetical protein
MATVWGSGTQADPWTRWEGSAYDFWRSTSYNGTYYTRVGAYFNITDAGDPNPGEDYWISRVTPNRTYGLIGANSGMSGTCTSAGTLSLRIYYERSEGDDVLDSRYKPISLIILPPPSYTVSVYSAGGGTVSGGGTYTQGSTATISATPDTGYHFTNWSDGDTNASRSFQVWGDVSLTAYFAINTYTVSVLPGGNGTVSGGGTYNYGASCTITATPYTGYHFTNWSDGNTSASRTFTVTDNVSLTAYFAINTYNVSLTAGTGGTVSGGGTYNYGSTATITATPSEHYHFTNWSDSNTNASRSFTVTGNVSLTAYFAIDTHTISTAVSPSGTGSVSGGGTYNYGASATLTATPASGYEFSQWSDGDTSNPRTVTVSGNATYTAQFVLGVATTNVKVNGSWVTGSVYVKVNGSWVASKKIYVKVNDTWQEAT